MKSVLFCLLLSACGSTWKDEQPVLDNIGRANALSAKYQDGGLGAIFNKSSYCSIRGLELRHGLPPIDAGLSGCPQ